MASGICPVADSKTARGWPDALPAVQLVSDRRDLSGGDSGEAGGGVWGLVAPHLKMWSPRGGEKRSAGSGSGAGRQGGAAADSQGSLSHPLGTVQTMETRQPNGQPSGHETAAALVPRAAVAAAESPATAVRVGADGSAAADSPSARETLSHPLGTVQTMETRQPNGHGTAAIATADSSAAAGRVDTSGTAAADSQGSLSHPLGTVQTMETRQPNRHETAAAALFPRAAGATADTPAAGRPDAGRPAPAADGGGVVPGVVFVGTSDVSGRVAALVDALVAELGGLPAVGAGRDLLRSQVAALGRLRAATDAAEARVVAAVDGLGDGGVDAVEVLRRGTGSSQREAQRRKRRADALAGMPNVAGALAAGDISTEHAEALARAAEATSAGAVDGDAGLLAEVAAVPADRAGRRIQEWTQRHQDPDDLHEQHLRQRRRRRLSFGDGDDGMLIANAAFDRVQGAQFRSLINGIADRIWRSEGGRNNPHSRSAAQRRLDALAIAVGLQPPPPAATARTAARTEHANPAPCNPDGPEPAATAPKTERGPRNEPASPTPDRQPSQSGLQSGAEPSAPPLAPNRQPSAPRTQPTPNRQPSAPRFEPTPDGQTSPQRLESAAESSAPPATPNGQFESPRHQVVIVASADVVSGEDPHGRCEIPGVGPIPQSELERLACDAELFGLLFSGKGEPLWHGRAKRTVTDAQRRALIARDGGCVLCAEEPARCEAHHITPWAKPGNGPTDIDNLALLCGTCHRRLHNHKRLHPEPPQRVLTRKAPGTAPGGRGINRPTKGSPLATTTPAAISPSRTPVAAAIRQCPPFGVMSPRPVRMTARTLASWSFSRSMGRVLIFLSRVMNSRFRPSAPISWKISVSLAPSGSSGMSLCPG